VEQLEKEQHDRDNNAIADDPLAKVDMTPWSYLRTMIFIVALGWVVQLTGHAIECVMGERMLTSNPGQPPWSRAGQWYGWEHGPVSSKHYAHVTPQRGHWAWQKGWGPQGQQELWASDMFGFAPEADAWWSEPEGPEPLQGAAGFGENTWAKGTIAYGQNEPKWGPQHAGKHSFDNNGGHRRLAAHESSVDSRPVVPVPVQWPAAFEPDHLACGPHSAENHVAAVTVTGFGALVPLGAASGQAVASPFTLEGLLELGMARSVTWGHSGLLVLTGSGKIASCPMHSIRTGKVTCTPLSVPPLPGVNGAMQAAVVEVEGLLRAAVAGAGSVSLMHLGAGEEGGQIWYTIGSVELPQDSEVTSVAATHDKLLVTTKDGVAHHWDLVDGLPTSAHATRDIPAAGDRRSWQSACVLPTGKIMRLASSWQRAKGGASTFRSELLL